MEVPLRGGSEAERAERDEMLTLAGRKRAELGGALEVETIHPLAQKRRRSFCRTANQKNQITSLFRCHTTAAARGTHFAFGSRLGCRTTKGL